MIGRAAAMLGAAWLLCAAAPCGTVVIPNGIGLGPPSAPTGLNPVLVSGDTDSLQVALLLYRPLVWIGQDVGFDHDRSLAEQVQALDGNTRFRVTLKPWRWSDGVAISADDVKFGFDAIAALGTGYASFGQGGVPDQVAAVLPAGPRTVDFVLKRPVNPDWFTLNGLSLIYPLPLHAWGRIDTAAWQARQLDASFFRVTDGPFRLTELWPDRYAAFAPNPLYGGHAASLQRLVVVFPEADAALHEVQAGETDMARVPYAVWPRLQGRAGFRFMVLPEPYGYAMLALNLRGGGAPFLRDARVRRALAQAVDQGTMIRQVFAGRGTENHMPAPTEPATWRRAAAGEGEIRFDRAAAAAALDQAGWTLGPDGVRHRGGATLSFTTIVNNADSDPTQMVLSVQDNLRAVGVRMVLRIMPFTEMIALLSGDGGDWDAAIVNVTTPSMPDGVGNFTTGQGDNWGGNFGRYSDATMDRLINDSVTKPGHDALFDYQDYAAAQQPGIFLPQGKQLLMVSDRLRGVEEFVNAVGFWSPEYLAVDDAACHGTAGR
jgi:peptide/nickel transport system substrate-binding protein